jgi:hypothetical protein
MTRVLGNLHRAQQDRAPCLGTTGGLSASVPELGSYALADKPPEAPVPIPVKGLRRISAEIGEDSQNVWEHTTGWFRDAFGV